MIFIQPLKHGALLEIPTWTRGYFFPEPLYPKNPYNNIEFNHTVLYNIYFHMEKSRMIIPTLFRLFYNSNFNTELFLLNNEQYIRDSYIRNYAYTTPSLSLFNDVKKMLDVNKFYTKKLLICMNFQKI